jgi:hypothetical protein
MPTKETNERRGRPKGSPSLTKEVEDQICALISGGVFDYIAAEAAGISDRTFRDWMARGEGRGPRPGTARHRAFAKRVRAAKAAARAKAELKVYEDQPRQWLRYGARSTPEREGWSDLPQAAVAKDHAVEVSDHELRLEIQMMTADLVRRGIIQLPVPSAKRGRR